MIAPFPLLGDLLSERNRNLREYKTLALDAFTALPRIF